MQDKALSLLGIAKKAGKLAVGSEASAISARKAGGDDGWVQRKPSDAAHLIITAADASESTIRRAKANAEAAGIKHIATRYTMFELGNITGRGSPGVIAFLDKGLAESFCGKLEKEGKESDA